MRVELLTAASSTGAGRTWNGGAGAFMVAGTLGGATVSLQVLGPDGATWIAVGDEASFDSAGICGFSLPPGQIRAAVSGGSPSGLYASAATL